MMDATQTAWGRSQNILRIVEERDQSGTVREVVAFAVRGMNLSLETLHDASDHPIPLALILSDT